MWPDWLAGNRTADHCPMADFPDSIRELSDADLGWRIGRRRVLGTLGMAGAASLLGSGSASAQEVVVRVGGDSFKNSGLPEDWLRRNRYAGVYHRYVNSLKLDSIDATQMLASHAKNRNGVWNTLPPRDWWRRMGYVLKVVDRIAKEMDVEEVEIVSAYRSPAYNSRCYGAKKGSWHKANVAVDVAFANVSPSKVTATARQMRKLGLFRGGVGGYRGFTHIDARGFNADW